MVISNAKVTVLAAAGAAFGAILNTIEAPPWTVVLTTVAGIGAVYFAALRRNSFSLWAGSRTACIGVLTALILSMSALTFYVYAQTKNNPAPTDLVSFSGRDVIFIATADRDACKVATHELALNCEMLLFPKNQKLSGRTMLTFLKPPKELFKIDPTRSTAKLFRWRIRGHVHEPRKDPPPWEYDKRKKLAAAGIFSICKLDRKLADVAALVEVVDATAWQEVADSSASREVANTATSVKNTDSIAPWTYGNLSSNYEASMAHAREQVVATHRKYLPPRLADLLASMVLGNRAVALSAETTTKFRDVGLSHILAASGFNLTIVTVMCFALVRLVTPSVVLANTACLLSMIGFVSLAGPSPSVVRAALMCTIMLASKSGQRKTQILSALALAFLLTVTADPLCTNDLGLQLSYAATIGIVLGSKALATQLYSGKSKWNQSLADAISVVLIAQFSVMPIQVFFFWRAGITFIPANLLITPLVTPLTMVGFASSTLALISWPEPTLQTIFSSIIAFADAVAFIPLATMVLMVNAFASLDAANFTLGPPTVPSIIFYYAAFLALMVALRNRRMVLVAALSFLSALVLLLWRPQPPLVTMASVHAHTIFINSIHQAADIDATGTSNRLVERFCAYHGAKLSPESFSTGALKSGVRFVSSQKWLLVMLCGRNEFLAPFKSAEILLTARKMQCERIVIIIRSNSQISRELLPPSEYKISPSNQDTELKFIDFKNLKATVYSRR